MLNPRLASRARIQSPRPPARDGLEIIHEDGDLVVRAFSSGRDYLIGDRVRRSDQSISWRAVETRSPVVVDDYAAEPDSRALYRARGICAAAVFPIVRGE